MQPLPDSHNQVSSELAPSTPTQKWAAHAPRRERRPPPLSLNDTKFGRYYTSTPSFEQDEEYRRSRLEADPTDLGYKYGSRFRKERSQPDQNSMESNVCNIQSGSSGEINGPFTKISVKPLIDSPRYQLPRVLPKLSQEMVQRDMEAGKTSPLRKSICYDTSKLDDDTKRQFAEARCRYTWSHSEDELIEMNTALDYLLTR